MAGLDAWEIAVAGELAQGASEQIDWWQARRFAPGPAQWGVVESRLYQAEALSPQDPWIPELLGVMHLDHVGSAQSVAASIEDFKRSLSLRPSSPYTWADLAEARMRAGMGHDPVREAMLISFSLGAAEPEVQRMLVDLGLAMWTELPAQDRDKVTHALEQAMRRSPYRTLPIVFARGHLEMACPFVKNDTRLARTVWPQRCEAIGTR